jgi:hypothetical protein
MECKLIFQVKLPAFIDAPLNKFVDDGYKIIEQTRADIASAMPLQCAPADIQALAARSTGDIAALVAKEIEQRIKSRIEEEGRKWLQETAIQTIIASIPTAGTGGAAVMSTSLGQFVFRVHRTVQPILQMTKNVKEFADVVGLSTSCGWSDWRPL